MSLPTADTTVGSVTSFWSARTALRALALGTAVGAVVLTWVLWQRLRPAPTVPVVAVIAAADAPAAAEPGTAARATGWFVCDPMPIGISAQRAGTVLRLHVRPGMTVAAGAPVAELDARDAELAERRALAAIAAAEAVRDRTRAAVAAATARAAQAQDRRQRLTRAADVAIANDLAQAVHEEAALRADLELMQAAVREAEAAHAAALIERDAAALDRQRCTITAPAAGVILRVAAAPGQHLSLDSGATALIAELFDPAHLIVRADVPLADAGRITPGMRVAVACDLLPGREWSGRVAGAPGAADAARNTVAIPIAFDAAPPGVRPDMLARVRFLTEATAAAPATAVLLAPSAGLRARSGDAAHAWVVDADGLVRRRAVTLAGEERGGWTRVAGGLSLGEPVVVGDVDGLHDGRRVAPVFAEAK